MLHLCRRIGSTDSVSRILSACLSSSRSNLDTTIPPCLLGLKTLFHTTTSKPFRENNYNTGPPNPMASLRGGTHNNNYNNNNNISPANPMSSVHEVLEEERANPLFGAGMAARNKEDEKLDVVHIKMIKNNTFVTVTDSKGNKKAGASLGCLEEMKGGPKASRYAAEATAEHVGRLSRNLGLKSVVMRVNGYTHFKKKRQAILAWREGFTHGRGDRNPVAYIEDTTRKAHNGCRLPKKRRV